jgi:hypothetical protein
MPTVEDLRIVSEGLTQKLGRLPSITEIARELDGNFSTNFARVKRMLTEGTDYAKPLTKLEAARLGGAPIPKHVVMADDIEGLKKLRNKVNKLNRVNKLDDKLVSFKVTKTQAGNYTPSLLDIKGSGSYGSLEDLKTEFNKIKKTEKFKNYSKTKSNLEGGIKSSLKQVDKNKLKVFEYLTLNENASLSTLLEDLNIKKKEAEKALQYLYSDIHKRGRDSGAVYLKNYSDDILNSVRNSIKNTGVKLKDRVIDLVTEAYEGRPEKKQIVDKIKNFYSQMAEVRKQPFGKYFVGNLDHVIPLNFLRQIDEGQDVNNLIRIKPLPEFLNQRAFKAQFDKVLGHAYKGGNKKALEAIVNIQSYLPQDFGGITADGKIKDYGAKPFNLKTNLSVAKFPEVYKRVFEFINNPELQKTFKEAGVSFKNLASKEKLITRMADNFLKYRADVLADAERGGAVCQIFRKAGGRIGFQVGGNPGCVGEVEEALKRNPKKFAQDMNKTEGVASTIKDKGTKFLTALKENPNLLKGGLAGKIALGLGTVAAGAGAGALVKQFRNDDPSTYLTNEGQMEGMIISDVEDRGEYVENNLLLDNQFKVELAGAAALTAPIAGKVYRTARGVGEAGPLPEGVGRTRAALGLSKGVLGKGLWALGAPIVALPSTVGYIAQDVRAGKDAEEIATNPLNYLGAAFMSPAVKALGKAGASRGLLGIASLGLAGTAAAPLLPALSIGAGLATLGTLGYQGYKALTGRNRSDEDFFR